MYTSGAGRHDEPATKRNSGRINMYQVTRLRMIFSGLDANDNVTDAVTNLFYASSVPPLVH